MAYSTTTDVQNAAGGAAMLTALSDYDGDGTADATVITAAIAAADADIDSYASKRFDVPFSPVPTKIVELSARLAVYKLRTQRQTLAAGDLEQNKSDLAWLADLRDGKVTPGVDPLPAKSSLQVDEAGERDSTKALSYESSKGLW